MWKMMLYIVGELVLSIKSTVVVVSFEFFMKMLCILHNESGFMSFFYIQTSEKSLFPQKAKMPVCLHLMKRTMH